MKWVTPALLVIEVVLLIIGRIALGQAVVIFLAVEIACAAVVLTAAAVRYRSARRSGQSFSTSAVEAADAVLPGPILRVVQREAQMLGSVGRWILRRPVGVPAVDRASPDAERVVMLPYGRDQVAFVWIFIGLTALEIGVVEVIVPWTAVRLILLILGLYGLLIMAGFIAANRTRPHILTSTSLHLRAGLLAEVTIPIERVATVSIGRRSAGYAPVISGDTLSLGVAGSTHAAVHLRVPTAVHAGKVNGEVRTILFAADDPSTAAQLIRAHVPDTDNAAGQPAG